MPSSNREWIERVKAAEREFASVRVALDFLLAALRSDPLVLVTNLKASDFARADARLDGTYTIRLFAEFETGLRSFWMASRNSDPPSRTRDLVDGIAARQAVPTGTIADVHLVREYRNSLVHERDDETPPIAIPVSRRNLCTFLSRLPLHW